LRVEKKMKNDGIDNNFLFEVIFSNKKIAIKRTCTKSIGERNLRANMIFSRGSKQIEVEEREKKRGKKNKLVPNQAESPCTHHPWRQRTPR
jgi:hypothetical protein